jgi:hypothetical protein
MMRFDPVNYLGKKGYVKISKGIYVFGQITETGISGASGYYAILEFTTPKNRQCKLLLEHIKELKLTKPNNVILISK